MQALIEDKQAEALRAAGALYEAGRLDEAEAAYRAMLAADPDHARATHMLAVLAFRRGAYAEADALFERAIGLDPGAPNFYSNRANALKELDRMDEALAATEHALKLQPRFAAAHNNRGLVLTAMGRHDAALAAYERAVQIEPGFAEAWSNRGIALQSLELFAAAVQSYDHALRLKPDYPEAHYNRAIALGEQARPAEAIPGYAQALALRPSYADAAFGKSLALLAVGEYEEGWQLYEARWASKVSGGQKRVFAEPQWLGEDVQGKTVVLHAEQGLGDSIQFCRYAPLLADRGAKVILDVPSPLVQLMRTLDPRVLVTESGVKLPPRDYHSPLLSLPLAFKSTLATLPRPRGYLRAEASKVALWQERLGARTASRIGLVWSGSTAHKSDQWRSLRLKELLRYLPPGFDYVCLQKEVREVDAPVLAAHPEIRVFSELLTDFSETAALVQCMDLVISVDTSVAHLAGALARPVWILVAHRPDWRWLHKRTDSPWYPTAGIIRQPQAHDWPGALRQLQTELAAACRSGHLKPAASTVPAAGA
ncbi:tetratricopeptide repeat protein [Massilia sp. TS11]|uniref:tetratricopeptide repeat-containing glycosyltransferase family protein n=1 Tax=Massilia sp. TS11 TaxID=2908003 RepID=UPI001EDB5ABD|nr:tetratricopeptide repeat-containing glycosyltransferase family protein [Massilia sp. TS11]MCG2586313.1 tetratricopeptide repeat-containing glycosyltransferase family protein [Massilia sp. TS11]